MSSRTHRHLSRLGLALLLSCVLCAAPLHAVRARTLKGILFVPAPSFDVDPRAPRPEVIRSRRVTIDTAALMAAPSDEVNGVARPALLLNLFDDLAYTIVADRVEPVSGGFTWVGHAQGFDGSLVTLASVDGAIAGNLQVPDGVFVVRYLGDGVHEVAQIDPDKLLPERSAILPESVDGVGLRSQEAPLRSPDASTGVAISAAAAVEPLAHSHADATAPTALLGDLVVDVPALHFAATRLGATLSFRAVTPPQRVRVATPSGSWMATADQPWLHVSAESGSGDGAFLVAIRDLETWAGTATSLSANVSIATQAAPDAAISIPVTLALYEAGATTSPVGEFEIRARRSAAGRESVSVAGWAVDDVGIERIELWRDRVPGDPETTTRTGPARAQVFVARPTLVAGARPDVEAAFANTPMAHDAGWSYAFADDELPPGTDPLRLYAFALDVEGHWSMLNAPQGGAPRSAAQASRFGAPTCSPATAPGVDFVDPMDSTATRVPGPAGAGRGCASLLPALRVLSAPHVVDTTPAPTFDAIAFRIDGSDWQSAGSTVDGVSVVTVRPGGALECRLPASHTRVAASYLMIDGVRRPIPDGANGNGSAGGFSWRLAESFAGVFEFEIVDDLGGITRIRVVVG
jgi:hypothetical protein